MVEVKESYGVIYIWFDRKHKRYYIGSHWGKNPENDGYICSSNWMRDAYKRRPNDFKRRIISRIYTSRHDLLNKELQWFSLIKPEEIRIRYYNINITNTGHWTAGDNALPIREKISKSKKGKPSHRKGTKHSDETKAKLSGRKHSEETRAKLSAAQKGRKHSEEAKAKISAALKGKPRSEETKDKMSISQKGRVHSEETKAKMSIAKKGRVAWNKGKASPRKGLPGKPHTEETKIKLSNLNKGKVLSEETKAKMSLTRKAKS